MKYIAAYRATRVPRFHGNIDNSQKQLETLYAGTGLWSAAQIHFVETVGLSVEYRMFTSRMPEVGKTSIYLLLGSDVEPISSEVSVIEQFEKLLPEEYGWQRSAIHLALSSPGGDGACSEDPEELARRERVKEEFQHYDGWKVARIVRRIDFVGVPRLMERPLVSLSSPSGPSSTAASKTAPVGLQVKTNDYSGIRPRILPSYDRREMTRELRRTSPCLPLLGPLSHPGEVPHRLFRELQHAAPVIVSIAIHPVEKESLVRDRIIATAWSHLLQLLKRGIANAGGFDAAALDAVFHRYWLPERYLTNLSMRVAAQDPMQSVGVAQHICARFGGMKAFEVMPPTREKGNPIDDLAYPHIDIPTLDEKKWDAKQWAREREFWRRRLASAGIAAPEDENNQRLDFLARFPHLYTLEETQQLMALPVADEEGLSGLDSQMLSPFSAPQLRYDPVIEVRPYSDPNSIRIGIVRTKPVFGESSESTDHEGEHWHTIPKKDLSKHALIVGSTGSGKTQTTLFLARELFRVGVPFTIIEPVKTEYFDRLNEKLNFNGRTMLRRFNFEGNKDGSLRLSDDFLAFDPMRLQTGVSVVRHASFLKSCFEAAFPLSPVGALVLENGLLNYYTDEENGGCGLPPFATGGPNSHQIRNGKVFPSLRTFAEYFCGDSDKSFINRTFPVRGSSDKDTQEVKDVFRRRFQNLTDGLLGYASKKADKMFFDDKFGQYEMFSKSLSGEGSTIIELDGIPDPQQKSLVMAFLMTFLFERRQADDLLRRRANQNTGPVPLRHVLIVEEAHRLLENSERGQRGGDFAGQDPRAKAVSLFVDMLAEIRAYGQGIVIVEQIPKKIVPEAVKNTNLRIMLRLTSKDDRDFLGEAMNFTEEQKHFVTGLKAKSKEEGGDGIQFVVFEEGIDQPRLLTLPLPSAKSPKNWLYDEFFNLSTSGGEGCA
jgi:hypothetical protein